MLIILGNMHDRSECSGRVRNRERERERERKNGRKKELRDLRFSKRCYEHANLGYGVATVNVYGRFEEASCLHIQGSP